MGVDEQLWGNVGRDREHVSFGRFVARSAAVVARATFTAGSLTVVRHEGEVLLVRERYRDPGLWGLPGGFWGRNEPPVRAAARELNEETSLPLEIEAGLEFVAIYPQWWRYHIDALFLYEARTSRPPAVASSHEIAEVGWYPEAELPPLTREASLAFAVLKGDEQFIIDLSTSSDLNLDGPAEKQCEGNTNRTQE